MTPWQTQIVIARIITRLNVGGPAIQAILMTDSFRSRGYNAVLIAGKVAPGEAAMDYLAQAQAVDVISLPEVSRSICCFRDILGFIHLVRILYRYRPTIVHTHTAKAGALGRVAAMLAGVPIRVHTFHGHVFHGYFSPLITHAFLTIERFLARHTDCIIAISESQKKELVEVYHIAPAHKIAVVPLGLELDAFLQVNGRDGFVRRALDCDTSVPLIGWVGRFTAIKDPNLFLDCVSLMRDAKTRFVMVGGGELLPECEQSVHQERLENSVTLLGWQQDLARIYADVDMVVCTSVNEGTPVAMIEAMASAKPIVSTDVGGVRDLMAGSPHEMLGMELFENGILVQRDPQALARAIHYLLEHPERGDAMGQAGREFARQRFSQHRLADDLESLYLSLARSKHLVSIEAVLAAKATSFLSSNNAERL